jgi:hypothetical protein
MLPVEGMVGAVDPSPAEESGGLRLYLRRIWVRMGAADIDTRPASTF